MYVNDHPPPHFHAYYQNFSACFSIETGERIEGDFPPTQSAFIKAWALMRKKRVVGQLGVYYKKKGIQQIYLLR